MSAPAIPPPIPAAPTNDPITSDNLQSMFENLASKHFIAISEDRAKADAAQRAETKDTLENWKKTILDSQQTLLSEIKKQPSLSAGVNGSTNAKAKVGLDAMNVAIHESSTNRSKIMEDIKSSYEMQMQVLKQAISEERSEASKAQMVFEQTLQTKYDNMVQALREKISFEHEARMKRALEELEKTAVAESVRAKQAFELQQQAEAGINSKFKALVVDLRKSWEQEEIARSKQLEERLRCHYTAVLNHMEVQLQLALKLQDDADKQWMEDVEIRNRQQVNTLKAFEAKCRRLYDGRLSDYIAQTNAQLNEYEDELLKMGNTVAQEKASGESRIRRLKLACAKWKCDYQKEVHCKYTDMVNAMESKYMVELESVCDHLKITTDKLHDSQMRVQEKERALLEKEVKLGLLSQQQANQQIIATANMTATNTEATIMSSSSIKESLNRLWSSLGTPTEERVQMMIELFDSLNITLHKDQHSSPNNILLADFVKKYRVLEKKLSARLPISKLITNKQYLAYKLRALVANPTNSNPASNVSSVTAKESMLKELHDIDTLISVSVRKYAEEYGESYYYSPTSTGTGASTGSDVDTHTAATSTPASTAGHVQVSSPMALALPASPALQLNPSNSNSRSNANTHSNVHGNSSGHGHHAGGTSTSKMFSINSSSKKPLHLNSPGFI